MAWLASGLVGRLIYGARASVATATRRTERAAKLIDRPLATCGSSLTLSPFTEPTVAASQSVPEGSEPPPFPSDGRLAAVDYGTVRIGVAICDPERILVSPYAVHRRGREAADADFFRRLAIDERVAGFIVGLPIHCDGGESPKSREARQFARWLHELTGCPTRLFDERFTTAQARRRLRPGKMSHKHRKERIDAIAAQVLLEAFLEVAEYTGQLPGQAADAPPEGDESLD